MGSSCTAVNQMVFFQIYHCSQIVADGMRGRTSYCGMCTCTGEKFAFRLGSFGALPAQANLDSGSFTKRERGCFAAQRHTFSGVLSRDGVRQAKGATDEFGGATA